MFQAKAPEAFEVLCKHLHANDPKVSVTAAKEILDRAYGRSVQSIDANINEENSSVRYYAEVPEPCSTTEEWLAGNLSGPMPLTDDAVTIIWIEHLRHSDARLRYSSRGQLYRTRLGGPDGEVLCDRVGF
jgi:hypothetical protein